MASDASGLLGAPPAQFKPLHKWSQEEQLDLAKVVMRFKGYKNTELTYEQKFTMIVSNLITEKPKYAAFGLKPLTLQQAFKRQQEVTLKALGISEEGANLSGLPEDISELHQLHALRRPSASGKISASEIPAELLQY